MPSTKEIECKGCGNSCTISYDDNPYEEIMFCPFCGEELDDDLQNFIDEDSDEDEF